MLYSIKNRDVLENLIELVSLQSQVKAVKLQVKLGKQIFHEDMRKRFEPDADTTKNSPTDFTKTMMLTCKGNNKALENLDEKL